MLNLHTSVVHLSLADHWIIYYEFTYILCQFLDSCFKMSSMPTLIHLSIIFISWKCSHLPAFLTSLILYTALMDVIREDVGMLTLLAEVLCMLDMIVNSFAHMISTKPVDRYTRPEFTSKHIWKT